MTSSIPMRHTLIFSHVLNELKIKSNHKEINMHKNLTKTLFTQKVIKELEQHPFYLENKTRFDIAIDKFQKMEKQIAIKDIITLLEQNFKYKMEHKKKFHHVLKELYFHFHKQKYSNVMNELLERKNTFEKTNVFEQHPNQIEHMLALFFAGFLLIRIIGYLIN
jgi:hypothetical protein